MFIRKVYLDIFYPPSQLSGKKQWKWNGIALQWFVCAASAGAFSIQVRKNDGRENFKPLFIDLMIVGSYNLYNFFFFFFIIGNYTYKKNFFFKPRSRKNEIKKPKERVRYSCGV